MNQTYLVLGDIHNCFEELQLLLKKGGFEIDNKNNISHPDGRILVLTGDLITKGPYPVETINLLRKNLKSGKIFSVLGNNDEKVLMGLQGKTIKDNKPFVGETIRAIKDQGADFVKKTIRMLKELPLHLVFEDGQLVIVHAYPAGPHVEKKKNMEELICFGHRPIDDPKIENGGIGLDTGCVYGKKLTGMLWPELRLISIKAKKQYFMESKD